MKIKPAFRNLLPHKLEKLSLSKLRLRWVEVFEALKGEGYTGLSMYCADELLDEPSNEKRERLAIIGALTMIGSWKRDEANGRMRDAMKLGL